jgi:hypothetical protein
VVSEPNLTPEQRAAVETALRAAGFASDDGIQWWHGSHFEDEPLDLREVFPSPWTVPQAGETEPRTIAPVQPWDEVTAEQIDAALPPPVAPIGILPWGPDRPCTCWRSRPDGTRLLDGTLCPVHGVAS